TVEQKVGQVLAPAISPTRRGSSRATGKQITAWIEKYQIGHLYLAGNRMDPVQLAELINEAQRQSSVPLLMHTDLECGPGSRIDGGTILPPLMGIAQTRSEEGAYQAAAITAQEARAMGFHLINSPVLDVNINPDNPVICIRSFGDNPTLVADMGQAFVRGLNDHRLIGAAKHFPGHGDVAIDSHSKMPTILADRQRLDSVEFYPYRQVIDAGLTAVMTAHISVPALDATPQLPATLSKPIMTDLLRGALGFDGLVITDAFNMKGILESGSFEESVVQSLVAGNDVVLLWTEPRFATVFPYVVRAVREGRISSERLDEAVRRNLTMKARLGLYEQKLVSVDSVRQRVGTPEHQRIADAFYEQSVVLVKNEGSILPLTQQKRVAVLSVNDDEEHLAIGDTFIDQLKQRTSEVNSAAIAPTTSEQQLAQRLNEVQSADVIVVALFARIFANRGSSSLIHAPLIRFLQQLAAGDTPVMVVSFGSPYLLTHFPKVDGYMIATEPTWDFYGYDKHRPGQLAAARALLGEIDITGRLAVTIPGLFPFGHGIQYRITPKTGQ
ncbi:MAG: glycoside hydrolase family 3 N-terminal domain-containing protein, partial [Tunicatimonas sp.]